MVLWHLKKAQFAKDACLRARVRYRKIRNGKGYAFYAYGSQGSRRLLRVICSHVRSRSHSAEVTCMQSARSGWLVYVILPSSRSVLGSVSFVLYPRIPTRPHIASKTHMIDVYSTRLSCRQPYLGRWWKYSSTAEAP